MAQKLTFIDLFCGAGGLTLGFEQAGFSPLLGVDADERALHSYAANFPQSATLLADISDISRTEMLVAADAVTATVVVGGPPCSGFSAGGRRRPDDVRNDLIMAFARAVAEIRPDYFVLENVPGLLDAHAAAARDEFAAFMQRAGYRVLTPWLLNAVDYEVPQERWRVFVVGHRDGVPAPTPPAPRPDRVSSWQAIGDLEVVDRISDDGATARITTPAVSAYSATMRGDIRDIGDRSVPRPLPTAISGCGLVRHGPELEQRFEDTLPGTREPVSRFPRLHPDRPSPTLRAGTLDNHGAHTAARPIHYGFPRCVTVREAARLQSLPDWFEVDRTKWRGFMQVGNSVPPRLARYIARSIRIAALRAQTQSAHTPR